MIRTVSALFVLVAFAGCARHRNLATFTLPGGFVCEILADKDYEVQRAYFGRVSRDSTEIVPLTFLTAYPPDMSPQFDLLSSRDGQVVGVAARHEPRFVLMLFDTKSLATWPRAGDSELPPSRDRRGGELLAILASNLSDPTLVLNPN